MSHSASVEWHWLYRSVPCGYGPNYGFLSSLGEAESGRMGSMGRRVLVDNPASDLSVFPHHTFGLRQKLCTYLPSLSGN